MFSINQRFQSVTNTALTYCLVLVGLIVAITQVQLSYHKNVYDSIKLNNFQVKKTHTVISNDRMNGGPNKQIMKMMWAMNADFSPLFTWNTKQVFVYLTGDLVYNTTNTNNTLNGTPQKQKTEATVTFWDKILTTKEYSYLDYENLVGKYTVWDKNGSLKKKLVNIKLNWNIQPYIGPLQYGQVIIPENVTSETLFKTPRIKKWA